MWSYNEIRQALPQVQNLHRWRVSIDTAPKGVTVPKNLMMRCTSSDIPKVASTTRTTIELSGLKINDVGQEDRHGQISLTLYEGSDAATTKFLDEWERVQNNRDTAKLNTLNSRSDTNDCKADFRLALYAPDLKTITQTYIVQGCLGSLSDPGGQLGQTADAQKPVLLLDFDDFHRLFS